MHLQHADLASHRKARGAFFTAPEIADFIVRWAVRDVSDRVLEPSCGEAAFLLSAATRLRQFGVSSAGLPSQLHGHDIHPVSIAEAASLLAKHDLSASLTIGDFFEHAAGPLFDAVVGNPPYVRYQSFSGKARAVALEAALRQGVRLNGLASSWAAFTVHAASFLKPGGRLGLVLPAELLTVKYAAQIRSFLLKRFSSVRLVLFDNLVFPGVLEDVVLLLAEGHGGASHFEVYQAKDAEDLKARAPHGWTGFKPRAEDKWTRALLSPEATQVYGDVTAGAGYEVMADWGSTYLGAVTGNNRFFAMTRSEIEQWDLDASEWMRISPPGSRHLRALSLSDAAWNTLADDGARCHLFAPAARTLSPAAARYVESGAAQGVHKAYKCKVRDPWWKVPLAPRPDFFFTYMNHDRPRLVRNDAGLQMLNSVYGVRLHAHRGKLGDPLLAIASLNSITLLGAEIVGRAYGGGMLKHEPTEVAVLPMPSEATLEQTGPRLQAMAAPIAAMVDRNELAAAIELVDSVMLKDHLGVTDEQIGLLRHARSMLLRRRTTRARASDGPD
jgi:adenine-specific DNA-methyltransferase